MNPMYVVLVIAFLAILFFSSRISWRFYQSTDKTNRILILLFAGGVMLMGIIAGFNYVLPLDKSMLTGVISIVAFISNGALWILIGREMWSVINKIRMMKAFRALEKPDQ